MDVYRNDKEKKISHVIFVVYLILLCWLILFKLAVTVDMIPHLRGVNWVFLCMNSVNKHTKGFFIKMEFHSA